MNENIIRLCNKKLFFARFELKSFQSTFNSRLRSFPYPDLLLDFIFKSSDEVKSDFRDSFGRRAIFKYIFRFRRFDWVYLSTTKRQKSLFSWAWKQARRNLKWQVSVRRKSSGTTMSFCGFSLATANTGKISFSHLEHRLKWHSWKAWKVWRRQSIALLDTAKFAKAPVSAKIEFRLGFKIKAFDAIAKYCLCPRSSATDKT